MVQARPLTVSVLIVATCSVAQARPRRAVRRGGRYGLSRRDWRRAKAALRKGVRLSLRKRFQEALAVFREGYERWKAPPFVYNEAVVLAQMGKYVEAVAAYRAYRRLVPGDESRLPPPLREAMARVGDIVVTCPKGVAIFVDGRKVGQGHVELLLEVGRHAVELRRHNKVILRKELRVESSQKAVWEVDRLPEPRPRTAPEAAVGVAVQASRRGLHWGYVVGLGGAAVVTFAAALGLSLKTKSLHDDFLKDRTNQALADEGLRYQTAANVMWGLAAASAVAAGIVAIFTDWKALGRRRERPVSVDVSGLGITVRGTW